jgi:hypothetical protein
VLRTDFKIFLSGESAQGRAAVGVSVLIRVSASRIGEDAGGRAAGATGSTSR